MERRFSEEQISGLFKEHGARRAAKKGAVSATYTPTSNFTGVDSFGRTVTVSKGINSAPATVTLAVNGPSVASPQSVMALSNERFWLFHA